MDTSAKRVSLNAHQIFAPETTIWIVIWRIDIRINAFDEKQTLEIGIRVCQMLK